MMKRINILLLVIGTLLYGQDKNWEVDLSESLYQVGWIEQSNSGTIIAAGAKGLAGMDNNTGETLWLNEELKNVDRNSFKNLPYLPLFYCEYKSVLGKNRGLVINSASGKILYDSKDSNLKIRNFLSFPEEGIVLFEALKDKTRYLQSFNLKTWEVDWTTELGKAGGLISRMVGGSFIDKGPIFDQENNLLFTIDDRIFALDKSKGDVKWDLKTKKEVKSLVYSPINNNLYVGVEKSNRLQVLEPNTGKDITPGKLKLRGFMIDLVKGKGDELILIETEGFNIIDPKTNTFKWKKSFKKDDVSEVLPFRDGYLAIAKTEKESGVARVNTEGKKIWDQNIKGYAYYTSLSEKGLIYISTERANILEFEKGKDVWKKDIKFRSIPAISYDKEEDRVFLFENKNGYKFDLKSGNIEVFAEDIELTDVKRKTPLMAETVDGKGYFLHDAQHLSLLSKSGKLVYSKYFPEVKSSDLLFQLGDLAGAYLGVDLDIKGSIENIKMLKNISNGSFAGDFDNNEGQVDANYFGLYTGTDANNMTPIFETTQTRYFNSKEIKDYQFVVTRTEDEAAKNKIYMINKATGEIAKKINLSDKSPNYLIDDVDKRVFINENNKRISSYDF